MQINLRTSNGHYVRAENGGGGRLLADREAPGMWEGFALFGADGRDDGLLSGQPVRLQVWNGQFVVANGGGGSSLRADRWQAAEWETFVLDRRDGSGVLTDEMPLVIP